MELVATAITNQAVSGLFTSLDANGDGFVDKNEIVNIRHVLQIHDIITAEDMQRGFEGHNKDRNGLLDHLEFRHFLRFVIHHIFVVVVFDAYHDERFRFTNLEYFSIMHQAEAESNSLPNKSGGRGNEMFTTRTLA